MTLVTISLKEESHPSKYLSMTTLSNQTHFGSSNLMRHMTAVIVTDTKPYIEMDFTKVNDVKILEAQTRQKG